MHVSVESLFINWHHTNFQVLAKLRPKVFLSILKIVQDSTLSVVFLKQAAIPWHTAREEKSIIFSINCVPLYIKNYYFKTQDFYYPSIKGPINDLSYEQLSN